MINGSDACRDLDSHGGGDRKSGVQDDETRLVPTVAKKLLVVRDVVGAGAVCILLAAR